MKKLFFITFILFAWALSAYGADLKIGYIDFRKAFNESDNGKQATKILEDMLGSKQAIITEKEAEIDKLRGELEKQSSVLTSEARKDKEEHLNKLYKDYQKMRKDFQEGLQKKEEELTRGILMELNNVIDKIGEEEGYDVIFEKSTSGIIYSNEKFDITEKVVKKYNEISKPR